MSNDTVPPAGSADIREELQHLRVLADITTLGLAGGDIDELLTHASRRVASALAVEFVGVFEVIGPDQGLLRLRAGVGWADDAYGSLTLPSRGDASRGGSLLGAEPVVFGDPQLGSAPGPEMMLTVGRVHGLTVCVRTPDGPFGVMGVFTPDRRTFDGGEIELIRAIADTLGTAIGRKQVEQRLRSSEQRMALAQAVGHMGSYDWNIATDTNIWSDELYRIYGTEPQSFNASYERFLSFIHPDDRDTVIAVHTAAYQDHQPYDMEERIVRPDGEVRILQSNGIVITDDQGKPARMLGICMDITERTYAELEAARAAERFEALIRSAPDAVFVVDEESAIRQVNQRAEEVFGYTERELVGANVSMLLPADIRARVDGASFEVRTKRKDGTEIFVDVSAGTIQTAEGEIVAAFVRDATARRRAEADARALHEVEVNRKQALEINDNVVQGLTSVVYSLEMGKSDVGLDAARRTLTSARAIMDGLLHSASGSMLQPGDLVRERAAAVLLPAGQTPKRTALRRETKRIVIADDSEDMRFLMKAMLGRGFDVVGEAGDGVDAIDLVETQRPDLILLDLAMPIMDGLAAIPRIRGASPSTIVVVLSGFGDERLKEAALAAGAHAYLEKGSSLKDLAAVLADLCGTEPEPPLPPPFLEGPDYVGHELRTPATVIQGLVSTLRRQSDTLPAAAVGEILDALSRNADQLAHLLDRFDDAYKVGTGDVVLGTEELDVGASVKACVGDLAAILDRHEVDVDAEAGLVCNVDPFRLRQIMGNLLTNAARFAPPGTAIDVRVRRADDVVEIAVSDRGPGISREQRSALFGRYSRIETSGSGLGLGLFISRGIARAHGGDLVLADDGPPGATFVVRLPLLRVVDRSQA